jgi:hypothetical protein
MKCALLAMTIVSAVPIAACTSPTSPSRAVGSAITIRGTINMIERSGPGGINVVFRIPDEPTVTGDANTTVLDGSQMGNTTNLRHGHRVTVEGTVTADGAYAKHVIIDSQ